MWSRVRKALERGFFGLVGGGGVIVGISYLMGMETGSVEGNLLHQIAAILIILVGIIALGIYQVLKRLDEKPRYWQHGPNEKGEAGQNGENQKTEHDYSEKLY